MTFGITLDGLATCTTAGSGRGVWETTYSEPLKAAVRVSVGPQPPRRPLSGAYKAPGDDRFAEASFPSRPVCVSRSAFLPKLTHSLCWQSC